MKKKKKVLNNILENNIMANYEEIRDIVYEMFHNGDLKISTEVDYSDGYDCDNITISINDKDDNYLTSDTIVICK